MKVVLILSGGMDSTTLCYDLIQQKHEVYCLSFNYGQKHVRELRAAMITTAKLSLPHEVVDLSEQLNPLLASALTRKDVEVPFGHYADDNMKATVVPNRNMIMLAIAAGYAISVGAEAVAYAAHAGDHTIYPDCRPEFREALQGVLNLCHFTPIELHTPYMELTKSDVCLIGDILGVPYGDTWTCYVGGEHPCGKCGACVERAESFAYVGAADPLVTASSEVVS